MAFNIQHQPNQAMYAKAVEGASRNIAGNQRLQQYASYLAGVQKANQQFGLGQQGLALEAKKVDQDFSINQFKALLDEKKLQADVKSQRIRDKATLMNAYSEQNRAHAAMMGAHKTLFLG